MSVVIAVVMTVFLALLFGLCYFTYKLVKQLRATEHELRVTQDQLGLVTDQRNMYRRHSTAARGALPYLEMSSDSFYGFARDKHKGSDVMANAQTRAFETQRNAQLKALRDLLVKDLGPLPRIDEEQK